MYLRAQRQHFAPKNSKMRMASSLIIIFKFAAVALSIAAEIFTKLIFEGQQNVTHYYHIFIRLI